MISVVIVEDHHIVRRGLRALLQNNAGIEVVGEAADGVEAIGIIEKTQPESL